MSDNQNSTSNLVVGLVLGAAVGAGITFLFGTKKGKQVRQKVHDAYPDFFDHLDEFLSDLKETLGDRYDEVASEVQKIEETVSEVVADNEEKAKEVVSEKVSDLGQQMENLGAKLQTMAKTTETGHKSPAKHFFKRQS